MRASITQPSELAHARWIAANREEYPGAADTMPWPTAEEAARAESRRAALLARLAACGSRVSWAANGSKPHTGSLSPGCRKCVEGSWSCLFVNGLCNGRCFFCPVPQTELGEPETAAIRFSEPEDWLDYLARFGMEGASISGGEPLLTLEKTLSYLGPLKRRFGSSLHAWLYSNGLLAREESLASLRDAGLDEIRFNLVAGDYALEAVHRAVKILPTVTVEIPAIPADLARLKRLVVELAEAGCRFLNLHHMRWTPYNGGKLQERGYTPLHGPKVTVLESELAALEVLADAAEDGLPLPINYCSYIYKHRFQSRGAHTRAAAPIAAAHESVTFAGYLRSLSVRYEEAERPELLAKLRGSSRAWKEIASERSILFAPELWDLLDPPSRALSVSYHRAVVIPTVTYQRPFRQVPLNPGRSLVVERSEVARFEGLSPDEARAFRARFLDGAAGGAPLLDELVPFETLGEGLYPYY